MGARDNVMHGLCLFSPMYRHFAVFILEMSTSSLLLKKQSKSRMKCKNQVHSYEETFPRGSRLQNCVKIKTIEIE